jgi:hypothetical protein
VQQPWAIKRCASGQCCFAWPGMARLLLKPLGPKPLEPWEEVLQGKACAPHLLGGRAILLSTLPRGMVCCSASGTLVGRGGGGVGATSASSMTPPPL